MDALLASAARLGPACDALVEEERRLTYAELRHGAGACCDALGAGRGDRVALALPNCAALVMWHFAVARAGAIAVNVNTRWTAHELAHVLDDAGCVLVVAATDRERPAKESTVAEAPGVGLAAAAASRALARTVRNLSGSEDTTISVLWLSAEHAVWDRKLPSPRTTLSATSHITDVRTPFQMFYTSGTSGKPKGVLQSHKAVITHARAVAALCTWRKGRRRSAAAATSAT